MEQEMLVVFPAKMKSRALGTVFSDVTLVEN